MKWEFGTVDGKWWTTTENPYKKNKVKATLLPSEFRTADVATRYIVWVEEVNKDA